MKSKIVYMMDALGNLWVEPDSLITWLIVQKIDDKIWKKLTRSVEKEKLGLKNRLSEVHQRTVERFEKQELDKERYFIPQIAKDVEEGALILDSSESWKSTTQIKKKIFYNELAKRIRFKIEKMKVKPWWKVWK